MTDADGPPDPADPECALVLAYAPRSARPALAALWLLDERLAGVVAGTREAGIGLIRLAWWREALERLDDAPAPAEPLLQRLAALVVSRGVPGEQLGRIADGWAALLADPIDDDALEDFALNRGGALFGAAAICLGAGDAAGPAAAGAGWALVDWAQRQHIPEVAMNALGLADARMRELRASTWPRVLRPLAALFVLARADARNRRCVVRPASPGRVARLAVAGLTGR